MAGGDTPTIRQAPATREKDRGATSLSRNVAWNVMEFVVSCNKDLSRNISLPKAVDIVGFVDSIFIASLLVAWHFEAQRPFYETLLGMLWSS